MSEQAPEVAGGSSSSTSRVSGGRLWKNGRFDETYDKLGPCLGSGGMGSVWAAHVRDTVSGSRFRGRWVAIKAIPIELPVGSSTEAASLHIGLRECLSTFQDLSQAHVVRYENYWLEEPDHLPLDIQQFCSSGAHKRRVVSAESCMSPQQALRRGSESFADSISACMHSLHLREAAAGPTSGSANGTGLPGCSRWPTSPSDAFAPAPSGLGDSCGFIWECDSRPESRSSSNSPLLKEKNQGPSSLSSPRDGSHADKEIKDCHRTSTVFGIATSLKFVVLLIEMELMGSTPDECSGTGISTDDRLTLTLRAWLQRPLRSLSDAADIFGALMLSVRHVHRKRIVHADLKPDNIFCVAERSKTRTKVTVVRIADFGLAGENQLFRQFDQFSSGMLRSSSGLVGGTPGYAAPELLKSTRTGAGGCACSEKVDIFACAIILLELLLPPFRTQMERIVLLDGFRRFKELPDLLQRLPKTRTLLIEMAEEEPAARLSTEEVVKRFEKEVRKELLRASNVQSGAGHLSDTKNERPASESIGGSRRQGKKGRKRN